MNLDHLSSVDFEEFTYDLLNSLGFVNVDWRKGSGKGGTSPDQGRDIVAELHQRDIDGAEHMETWFVQCKHYERGVPPDVLMPAVTWASAERPDVLLFVVSNSLSNPAKNCLDDYVHNNRPPFRIKVWERKDLERFLSSRGASNLLQKVKSEASPMQPLTVPSIILDSSVTQALSVVIAQLEKLLKEKDLHDETELQKIEAEMMEDQQKLALIESELSTKDERSPAHKNLSQRVDRLRNEIGQLRARVASLRGQRTLNLGPTAKEVREDLLGDLDATARWARQVSFLEARRSRVLHHIYIHLDIFTYPVRIRATRSEEVPKVPFEQLVAQTDSHFVLLGQAGAGKTTSMKRLFLMLYSRSPEDPSYSFPLLVRFRDLNSPNVANDPNTIGVIYGPLFRALRIKPIISDKLLREDHRAELREYQRMLVKSLLEALNATIILDGFDELVGAERREGAIAEIRELAISLNRARLILTSRSGDFNHSVDRMERYEIAPLDATQIATFARNWLVAPAKADEFVAQVVASPFRDTTIRPLLLAHLCAIYDRAGKIPEKPKTVYSTIVNLLVREWDEQRSVKRTSKFPGFTPDRKFDFLASLAFALTTTFGTTTFGTETLSHAYDIIHNAVGLPPHGVRDVITEIEGQTSLFLCTGHEQFEFAHKSLQEYLAAEYIVRLPNVPRDSALLCKLPNELAITIAISSDPGAYLSSVVIDVLHNQQLPRGFYDVFMDRLSSEHPDLGMNPKTAIALIVLVSLWSSRGGSSDARSIPTDPRETTLARLCVEFADLLRGPGREVVQANYSHTRVGASGFVELKRIHDPREFGMPTRLFIPKRLAEVIR